MLGFVPGGSWPRTPGGGVFPRASSNRSVEPLVTDPTTMGRRSRSWPRPPRFLTAEDPEERHEGRDGEGCGPEDDADHRHEEQEDQGASRAAQIGPDRQGGK